MGCQWPRVQVILKNPMSGRVNRTVPQRMGPQSRNILFHQVPSLGTEPTTQVVVVAAPAAQVSLVRESTRPIIAFIMFSGMVN